jgi:dihydrofolate synthase / folylpolyglutamate synthase
VDRGDNDGVPVTVDATPFNGFEVAEQWLNGHIDFESTMPSRRSLPTLDRMHAVMAVLGDPHLSIPSIHVTGTNGKGSTSVMVTALLMAQGLTVGTFTSPNLHRVTERIARDGDPIDDDDFVAVLSELASLEPLLAERLTRFELLTAAALAWFGDQAVDAMVIEVGLGGTWDCTNVVHGDVAVLTNFSYDHTDVLGPTLEGIALDKSGIVEPGCPVVLGETSPDLVKVVETAAAKAGAGPVWVAERDFGCAANQVAVGGRLVTLWTPEARYEDVLVPLHGAHQGANAATALAATEAFFGRPLDPDVVGAAMSTVRVPGRLEVLGRRPLLLVDGAHNVAGMTALGLSLAEEFAVDGETIAVVGMLSGRDPLAMLAALAPARISRVVACQPDSRRAIAARDVADAGRALGLTVLVEPKVVDALSMARSLVDASGLVVVAGSLYVVGDARAEVLSGAVRWEDAGR